MSPASDATTRRRRPRPRHDPARAPRPAAALAAAAADDHGRRRHAVPLPDRGVVPRAPAAELRLHGWYPGASLGHPLLLYYFPFPFLLMSALAPLVGMPVAFKLGTALGVFLLPLLVYASFRLMRLAFPAPAPGRRRRARLPLRRGQPDLGRHDREHAHRRVLVHLRRRLRHPLPRASSCAPGRTAAGPGPRPPCSRSPATRTATPCCGRASPPRASCCGIPRAADRGRAAALAHARLAAGGRGAGLRPRRPRPRAASRGLGLDDALRRRLDRRHGPRHLPAAPPAAPPRRRPRARGDARPSRAAAGGATRRLLLLGFGALAGGGARVGRAGPRRDRRALRPARTAVAGPRRGGRARPRARAPRPRRRGGARASCWSRRCTRTRARASCATGSTGTTPGLEAKELWPAWQELMGKLRGGPGDPRVAFEYGPVHERAGSIRMHETVPFFSGPLGDRGRLQPVEHHHAPGLLPAVGALPLLAEPVPKPDLLALRPRQRPRAPPPPQREPRRRGERPARVRARRAGRSRCARRASRPTRSTAWPTREPGYVEPLAFAPVRSPREGWRDQAVPLVLAQAAQPRRPRLHRRPALRRRGHRPLGAPARAARCRREWR